MDNDKRELNPSEMEQFSGGSKKNPLRTVTDKSGNTSAESGRSTLASGFKRVGKAAWDIGKGAYNWFTGLFSGND